MIEKTLYQRLGERKAIVAVVDELFERKSTDKQLSRFFTNYDEEMKNRVKGNVVSLLCSATGGPDSYIGRDMATIHTGLNITENDWTIFEQIAAETMDKFNVQKKEREEVFAAVSGLKKDIVGL